MPIAGAAALLLLATSAAAAQSQRPALRFTSLNPVKVKGTDFVASERVSIVVLAGKSRLTKTVIATRLGGFIVNLGPITDSDRCSGAVSIAATGRRGDHATYKLPMMNCTTGGTGISNS